MNSKCWWDSDFVSSFGTLLYHSVHSTKTVFVDCNYPNDDNPAALVKLSTDCEKIVAVAHGHSHYVLIHIDIHSRRKSAVIFDGIGSIPLKDWQKHLSFILRRCGIDPDAYINAIRRHNSRDYGGMKLKQVDGFNCGPIACMVLWHTFIPSEVDTTLDVSQFRSKIVPKMKALLEEAKKSGALLVRLREEVLTEQPINNNVTNSSYNDGETFDLDGVDDNEDNKLLLSHLIVKARDEVLTIDSSTSDVANDNVVDDNGAMYISPNHREKIEQRIESDMKRRKRQDRQANSMMKRFKIGAEPTVGDTVNLKVDIRDRNSTIPRGILGIVAGLTSTGSSNCAIYCVHGLLGSRGKCVYYPPDQYTIVPKPTLDKELRKVRDLVLDESFKISSGGHNIISVQKAHKLIYSTKEVKVIRGKCQCGGSKAKGKKKVQCGNRCGCIRNNRLCSSACSCSKDCPNKK